jgi:chromosome segregation ATPase
MNENQLSGFDWSWLWGVLGAGATQLVNVILNRKREAKELKKVDADVLSSEMDNVEKAIAIWRNIANDLNGQLVEIKAQVKILTEQVDKLKIENTELHAELRKMAKLNKTKE